MALFLVKEATKPSMGGSKAGAHDRRGWSVHGHVCARVYTYVPTLDLGLYAV
jgi:hypothetical protein